MQDLIIKIIGSRDLRISASCTSTCGGITGFKVDNRLLSTDDWYGGVMATDDAVKLAHFILRIADEQRMEDLITNTPDCATCGDFGDGCPECNDGEIEDDQ